MWFVGLACVLAGLFTLAAVCAVLIDRERDA